MTASSSTRDAHARSCIESSTRDSTAAAAGLPRYMRATVFNMLKDYARGISDRKSLLPQCWRGVRVRLQVGSTGTISARYVPDFSLSGVCRGWFKTCGICGLLAQRQRAAACYRRWKRTSIRTLALAFVHIVDQGELALHPTPPEVVHWPGYGWPSLCVMTLLRAEPVRCLGPANGEFVIAAVCRAPHPHLPNGALNSLRTTMTLNIFMRFCRCARSG